MILRPIRPGDRYVDADGQSGTCKPLNLGVCLNVLGGLLNLEVGNVPSQQCCSLIRGLVDLEASVCLCTAIRANVLDVIKLDVPISLSLLLNDCGRGTSTDYLCSP
ncbi:hypothetical protein V6N13_140719 [Hibiscus sabdariffa]|uniref:Bifunctional inhibitor/plant lipid transfer protein/seed storage helical domain-containing protein n=1 Tax=Hibiscus sabdariffa TaxID=183260 RepID=A0ABR2Q227_9ROSI